MIGKKNLIYSKGYKMSPIEIEPIKTTICGDKKKREIKSPQKIEVDLDCGCSPDKLCKMHKIQRNKSCNVLRLKYVEVYKIQSPAPVYPLQTSVRHKPIFRDPDHKLCDVPETQTICRQVLSRDATALG